MKYCKNCGAEMADQATACPQCGQPAEKGKQNVIGLVGFILAIVNIALSFIPNLPTYVSSIVWLGGFVCSIVGIVQAKKKNQKKSLAVWGLVLSLVGIVLILLMLFFLGAILAGIGGAYGLAALAIL